MVNSVAVVTLLLTPFYIAANKEYLTKRLILFRYVHSGFHQLYCVKFAFKLAKICRSYEENKTAHFFH